MEQELILSIVLLLALLTVFILKAFSSALRQQWHRDWQGAVGSFYYREAYRFFFAAAPPEELFVSLGIALSAARLCYGAMALLLLVQWFGAASFDVVTVIEAALVALTLLAIEFFCECFARLWARHQPRQVLESCSFLVSLVMSLLLPLSLPLTLLLKSVLPHSYLEAFEEVELQRGGELLTLIDDIEGQPPLDKQDKKLVTSVLRFREHIAREVMVPRVDLFALPADTTIDSAAQAILAEGYSRIPVYRSNIDDIAGVLMYKDVLTKYLEYAAKGGDKSVLDVPIEGLIKPALFTPETKKISNLLQEFRKRQVHMAIVVDEYGGTEGIVTIEDILEQIVGEIADEYDFDEEIFFRRSDDGWIVDARMSILDIEEELDIKIPQEGEYDSIGGYIFHCAGTIPQRGFVIHHDDFEITVLRSSERVVEQVKIQKHSQQESDE